MTDEQQQPEIPYVDISIDNQFTFYQPKYSNYTCYLFGGNAGFSPITWIPEEGKVPNAWVRFWMRIFLGCTWVKTDK